MLPISPREVVRFTPPTLEKTEHPPVFLLRIPTMRERIAYEAAITAEGARFPGAAELVAALRDGVAEHVVEAEQPALSAILDEVEGFNDTAAPLPAELQAKLAEIERTMRRSHRPFAELLAERDSYNSLAMLNRVELFVIGLEGEGEGVPEVERRADRLTEASVSAITKRYGAAVLGQVGFRILQLIAPDEDARGNSASPAPSPPAPAISTAVPKRRTARRGTSSGKSTK